MSLKALIYMLSPDCIKESYNIMQERKQKRNISNTNLARIKMLLNSAKPIKLELGAGQDRRIEGWTSVDMNDNCYLNLDLTVPLPFPDNSVEMIYSSHVLEHFSYEGLMKLLGECLIILRPGGIFSAVVPNARLYIEAYGNPDMFDPNKFCCYKPAYNYSSKIDYINYIAYMDGHHRHMFDEENILAIVGRAGFVRSRLREFDDAIDLKERDYESIYVFGEK